MVSPRLWQNLLSVSFIHWCALELVSGPKVCYLELTLMQSDSSMLITFPLVTMGTFSLNFHFKVTMAIIQRPNNFVEWIEGTMAMLGLARLHPIFKIIWSFCFVHILVWATSVAPIMPVSISSETTWLPKWMKHSGKDYLRKSLKWGLRLPLVQPLFANPLTSLPLVLMSTLPRSTMLLRHLTWRGLVGTWDLTTIPSSRVIIGTSSIWQKA